MPIRIQLPETGPKLVITDLKEINWFVCVDGVERIWPSLERCMVLNNEDLVERNNRNFFFQHGHQKLTHLS